MEYVGYILVFGAMAYAIYYSFSGKITFKKGAVTSLIILFISLIFIFDEITIDGVAAFKRARDKIEADTKAIEEIRKELESDAKELFVLKAKLDSMFTSDPEGIKFKKDVNFDKIETAADAGLVNMINHPLATSATTEGGTFSIGSTNILQYSGTGDGAGGIKDKKVELKGNLDILDPDNGVILTSSNGSKWLLKVKNSGELDITKF